MREIANVLLTHQAPSCVENMVRWWAAYCPEMTRYIVHGGERRHFDALQLDRKTYIEDRRLRTGDHPRQRQSYEQAMAKASELLAGSATTHVLFAEYDCLPLTKGVTELMLKRMEDESADVLGFFLRRIDGTSHPHYLNHAYDPYFHEQWRQVSHRSDPQVILSMLGCCVLWRREAFDVVANAELPLPIYLEVFIPTAAHHLGYRVCGIEEQTSYVHPRTKCDGRLRQLLRLGAWFAHPVKRLWANSSSPEWRIMEETLEGPKHRRSSNGGKPTGNNQAI